MGCMIMATVTAVGGGTIRDMFIGHESGVPKRSFWMGEPEYLLIVFVTCISTFSFWNPVAEYLQLSTDDSWEFWMDALGMGSFTCVGTMNGIRAGLPVPIVAMCGMFSATFGGLTRDVISRSLPPHSIFSQHCCFCTHRQAACDDGEEPLKDGGACH